MQIVSNDSLAGDGSEREPILTHPNVVEESSPAIEITVSGDCSTNSDDSSSFEADGSQLLLNIEQPQCRICLDTEGFVYMLCQVLLVS